jgi:hypothetical protein
LPGSPRRDGQDNDGDHDGQAEQQQLVEDAELAV